MYLLVGSPKQAKKAAKCVDSIEKMMISIFKKVTGFHSGLRIIFLKMAGAFEFARMLASGSTKSLCLLVF